VPWMNNTQRAPKNEIEPVKIMPKESAMVTMACLIGGNAGAHPVGGTEFGHPDEQIDGQFLCPVDAGTGGIAHHDGSKGDKRCGCHKTGNQKLLEVIQKAVDHGAPQGCRDTR